MDFLKMQLPEDDKNKSNFENINNWFDFMNEQFEKIEESNQKYKVNSVLLDNDIDLIE